jgi:DedD protein
MVQRTREPWSGSGWVATVLGLGVLGLVGFGLGFVAGGLFEEPELVAQHLLGGTERVAWESEGGAGAPAPAGLAEARPGSEAASDRPAEVSEPPAPPPVALAPPRAEPAPPPAPARTRSEAPAVGLAPPFGRLAIQVGAFAESHGAEQLAERLRAKGYAVYLSPGAGETSARWRVRVGPFASREEADRSAARLKAEERLPTWVLDEDAGQG